MKKMNLNEAVRYIVDEKGKSTLAESKYLKSMLSDLMGSDSKIIHFFVQASENHYFDFIAKCGHAQLGGAIEKASENLKNDYAEIVANEISDALYYAFSLTPRRKPQPQPQTQQIPQQQTIPQQQKQSPLIDRTAIIVALAVVLVAAIFGAAWFITSGTQRTETAYEPVVQKKAETPEPTPAATQASDEKVTEPVQTSQVEAEETPIPETQEKQKEEYRMGTVYIAPGAQPPRIIVRTAPKKEASTATSERKYNGDRVKVYETKQGSVYTWYRIGNNKWIAGNGTSFYVIFD